MRQTLRENWPMILALAVAIAIGLLVFTVLRPALPVSAPAPVTTVTRPQA